MKITEIRVVSHGGPAIAVVTENGQSTQPPWAFKTNAEAEAFAMGVRAAIELHSAGYELTAETSILEPNDLQRINFG